MTRDLYSTLDLNLLKILIVLYQEQNMRRASERLFVTQPAVSQSLKKLRHHFADELFVKTYSGLKPTPYTEELVERIGPLLEQLSSTLRQGTEFDPSGLSGEIRIALGPHMISFLTARLHNLFREAAPEAALRVENWTGETLDEIVKGELHLGLSARIDYPLGELMTEELADDHFTAYVREGHPVVGDKETVTLEDLDGSEIAALLIPGFNYRETHIERILKASGFRAKVGFRCPLPSAVIEVLRSSDMIFGASSFIDPDELKGLRRLDVRINNELINSPVTAYYHRRNDKNPMTLWLKGLIRGLLTR